MATEADSGSSGSPTDVSGVDFTMGRFPAPTMIVAGNEEDSFSDLSMSMTDLSGGPEALPLLTSGDLAGVADLSEGNLAVAMSAGIPFQIVWVSNTTPVEFLVDPSISSPGDLKGKKLADPSGSPLQILTFEYLERNGIEWDEIEFVDLAPPDAVSAYKAGAVDGTYLWPPLSTEVSKGGANSLEKTDVVNMTVFSNSFIEDHPDVVQAFVCDMAGIQEAAIADPKPTWQAVARALELKPAEVPPLMPHETFVSLDEMTGEKYLAEGGEIAQHIVSSGEALERLGQLEGAAKMEEVNETLNPEFVEAAQNGECQ